MISEFVKSILFNVGSSICHQLPERTIFLEGSPLPICARDIGIYTGMLASVMFLIVMKRWRCDKPPALKYSIVLCILMIFMPVDGLTSYIGLQETNNFIRILSGGLFGLTIPLFLFPVLHFKIDARNTQPSLRSWAELIALVGSILMVCYLVYIGILKYWWPVSLVLVSTIVFIYFRVAYTLISQFRIKSTTYRIMLAFFIEMGFFSFMYQVVHFINVYLYGGQK